MSVFLRCFNSSTKGAEGAKDLLIALASSKELEEPLAPLPGAHCASMSKPSCSFAFVGGNFCEPLVWSSTTVYSVHFSCQRLHWLKEKVRPTAFPSGCCAAHSACNCARSCPLRTFVCFCLRLPVAPDGGQVLRHPTSRAILFSCSLFSGIYCILTHASLERRTAEQCVF